MTGFFGFAVGAVVCDFETVAPTVASFKNLSLDQDVDVAVVELVEERLGFAPVLASFEVSVAIDDCASASFMFACPSCRVRSAIVFDVFATMSRSDCVAVARFAKEWLWSC